MCFSSNIYAQSYFLTVWYLLRWLLSISDIVVHNVCIWYYLSVWSLSVEFVYLKAQSTVHLCASVRGKLSVEFVYLKSVEFVYLKAQSTVHLCGDMIELYHVREHFTLLYLEGRSLLINTFLCAFLGDMGL